MSRQRQLFIDADVLVYEAAFAAQKTYYTYKTNRFPDAKACETWCLANDLNYRALRKDGAITSEIELLPEAACRNILRMKMDGILAACGTTDYTLVLSGDTNFRNEVAVTKPYKGNRSQPKPHHYLFMRDVIGNDRRCTITDGIEADDHLGISLTNDPTAVIATIDKDLNMVPGRHYNWGKGIRYNVKPVDALYWFCRQLLTGDPTDNIPGLPGWGEKGAEDLLQPLRDQPTAAAMWDAVLREYTAGPYKFKDGTMTPTPTMSYLTEQGQLLWMQRKPNELWTPSLFIKEYI